MHIFDHNTSFKKIFSEDIHVSIYRLPTHFFKRFLCSYTRSVQKVRGLLLKWHFPLSEWNKNWLNASSMYPGFSNIFKRIYRRRKMCKSVTMTTQDSHHGALQNFPFFFIAVPALFVCTLDQSEFNILKLMFLKEHL